MNVPEKEELEKKVCKEKCGKVFKDGGYFSDHHFKHFFCSFDCVRTFNKERNTRHVPQYSVEGYCITGPFNKNDRIKIGWFNGT